MCSYLAFAVRVINNVGLGGRKRSLSVEALPYSSCSAWKRQDGWSGCPLCGRAHVKRTTWHMRGNHTCLSWGSRRREGAKLWGAVWQAPLYWSDLVIEGSCSLSDGERQLPKKANRLSHIIRRLAPPQRGFIPILCKALREHVQPRR